MSRPAVLQAASLLLGHPDDDWPCRLDAVRGVLVTLDDPQAEPLLRFCERIDGTPPLELSARYVATFDRAGRRSLHLTYHTYGDTSRRGAALAGLTAHYLDCGWRAPADELPDFLPLVLEFAARCPRGGVALLIAQRPAVEALRHALLSYLSPYADVLGAVCDCLPGPGPASREEALRALRTGCGPVPREARRRVVPETAVS